MVGNPEKAKKYLALLDEARCNDRWPEITELARKIGKHAPQRQCLVYTARVEAEQASRSPERPLAGALPEASISSLRTQIGESEGSQPEDAYQARACLAQGLWAAESRDEVLQLLNTEIPSPRSNESKERRKLQGWTYVTAIRSAYLKELCLDSPDERGTRHETLFRVLESAPTSVQQSDEYSAWLEKFLMRMCLRRPRRPIWSGTEDDKHTTERLLAPFRGWLRCWELIKDRKRPHATAEDGSQREVWTAYYSALSQLLRSGYVYPHSSVALFSKVIGERQGSPRLAQCLEIRRVEAVYQELLLRETSFPEASKFNKDVDDCADQVMENWNIMSGPSWQEHDLGQDGREGLGRHVADFLYRAAAKTFHSCAILRHLFAVHASLGEFRLAAKGLDSYLEIVLKGKAREEKSGKEEPTLDTDEAIVQTIVSGVEMHCSYGKLEQALRAEKLCSILQDWLARHEKASAKHSRTESSLRPRTIALIHRAIGISKANWARYILEPSERSTLQSDAVKNLRQSLIAEGSSLEDPRTLYALSMVLAETRDTESAIATVKHALSAHSQLTSDGIEGPHSRTLTKTGVIRCWHLLALLLSARQEYEKAEQACDAALESIEDDENMSREVMLRQFNFFDKQQVIEIKLTQASLLEINSSSDIAVNSGSEALRLYAYLFYVPPEAKKSEDGVKPAGTLRHRGSLFHRKKAEDSAPTSTGPGSVYSSRISEDTHRPGTVNTMVDGNSLAPPGSSLGHSPSHRLQKRASKRSVQQEKSVLGTTAPILSTAPQINGFETMNGQGSPEPGVGVAVSHDLPATFTRQLEGITASHFPSLTLQDGQFNEYLSENPRPRVPYAPLPPRLSRAEEDQYSLGLLCSIWVFISGLYRRADLHDDSVGAIEEAFKLVQRVESLAAGVNSSVRQFEEPGWGGARSVDQLWADAHAESAYLHLAQQNRPEAVSKFETALSFYPDHPAATVGLSNLLLEIYAEKQSSAPGLAAINIPSDSKHNTESSQPVLSTINTLQHGATHRRTASSTEAFPSLSPFDPGIAVASVGGDGETQAKVINPSSGKPKDLDRLAARDRAFGLLSSLTRLGTSWDDSEAWFALARAYEESGQPDKSRDVLWWVVELEAKRPVRGWQGALGQGYSC